MKYAGKKEAQAALNTARVKAQNASLARSEVRINLHAIDAERDAADLHYQRRVRELEEAIFDYDAYDTGDD